MRKSYYEKYLLPLKKKRCVVKIGSSLLASKRSDAGIDEKAIRDYVKDICFLTENGWQVILVSSGAVAGGMSVLGLHSRPTSVRQLQSCAAVGQVSLMELYSKAFARKKRYCGQILLTSDDLRIRSRYINAKNTIENLLKEGIVPIVNENDTVATDEIAFGDNDRLSALVAGACDASVLLILSDVDGVYKTNSSGEKELVSLLSHIDETVFSWIYKRIGRTTKGGMRSKLEAALSASLWGIYTVITSGNNKNPVSSVLIKAKQQGTLILSQERKASSKRLWLAHIATPEGSIFVDKGAANAITKDRKSLLCPGIVDVQGAFNRGAVVDIYSIENKRLIARAIASLSSAEIQKNIGKRHSKEAMHRDNLVVF